MGTETERKFLVSHDGWRQFAGTPVAIQQGYFDVRDDTTVRVRLYNPPDDHPDRTDQSAELTIKGPPDGWRRLEFEYDIPPEDASDMLDAFCGDRIVQKRRFPVTIEGLLWTVDVFTGNHQGLVLAEIEQSLEQPISTRSKSWQKNTYLMNNMILLI